MEARDSLDITFLVTIVSVSGFGFVGIAVCYSQIYLSLGKETRHRSGQTPRGEMSIAKKMALLVIYFCHPRINYMGIIEKLINLILI